MASPILVGPCSSDQSLSQVQSFVVALADFKKASKHLSAIQEPLKILEKTFAFSPEVKLKHPRQVYPIYEALNLVTDEIAKKSLVSLSISWHQVLGTLNNRNIYRIGLGS